jgi:hypothetical protein
VREKAMPADLIPPPRAGLVVAVDAAAGAVAVAVEEEAVEAAQALQRRHLSLLKRLSQSMRIASKSHPSGENINGRPRNKHLVMDIILRSMHTPQSTLHVSLLRIWLCILADLSIMVCHIPPDTNTSFLRLP